MKISARLIREGKREIRKASRLFWIEMLLKSVRTIQ